MSLFRRQGKMMLQQENHRRGKVYERSVVCGLDPKPLSEESERNNRDAFSYGAEPENDPSDKTKKYRAVDYKAAFGTCEPTVWI